MSPTIGEMRESEPVYEKHRSQGQYSPGIPTQAKNDKSHDVQGQNLPLQSEYGRNDNNRGQIQNKDKNFKKTLNPSISRGGPNEDQSIHQEHGQHLTQDNMKFRDQGDTIQSASHQDMHGGHMYLVPNPMPLYDQAERKQDQQQKMNNQDSFTPQPTFHDDKRGGHIYQPKLSNPDNDQTQRQKEGNYIPISSDQRGDLGYVHILNPGVKYDESQIGKDNEHSRNLENKKHGECERLHIVNPDPTYDQQSHQDPSHVRYSNDPEHVHLSNQNDPKKEQYINRENDPESKMNVLHANDPIQKRNDEMLQQQYQQKHGQQNFNQIHEEVHSSNFQPKRTICFAIDGSESSNYAVEWGVKNLVRQDTDQVVLLNVRPQVSLPGLTFSSPFKNQDEQFSAVEESNRKESHQVLILAANKVKLYHSHVRAIALRGEVSEELVHKINELGADMVVCGTRGIRSSMKRTFKGSISDYLVHHLKMPVMVVHGLEDTHHDEHNR